MFQVFFSLKIGFKYSILAGKFFIEKLVIFRVGKLVRKIGLGEEVFSWKIIVKNLANLKINVRKLVSMKTSD